MGNNQALQFQAVPNYQFAVLPVGIHQITASELDDLFVKPFPDSSTRPLIAHKFKQFRRVIQNLIASEQWVDGSFVESKENPNDVDVAVWADANEVNGLPVEKQMELMNFCQKERTAQKTLMTDAYIMAVFDKTHPQYALYERNLNYWRKLFSHTRNNQPKGFISLKAPLVPSM